MQGVAVDSQPLGGPGPIASGSLQTLHDELLFKFLGGILIEQPAIQHFGDQSVQLVFHDRIPMSFVRRAAESP